MSKNKRKHAKKPKPERATIENEPPVNIKDEPIVDDETNNIVDDVTNNEPIDDEPEIDDPPKKDEPMICNIGGCGARVVEKGNKYQCMGKRRHTWVKDG